MIAVVQLTAEQRVVVIEGADLLDPLVERAETAATSAAGFAEDAEAARDEAATYALAAALANALPECATAATTNITLTGVQTIGGVAGAIDMRTLLTGQTAPAQNGPWLQKSGAWARPTDFDTSGEVIQLTGVSVTQGINAGLWLLVTPGPYTLGTTGLAWTRVTSTGSATTFNVLDNGTTASTLMIWNPPQSAINSEGGHDNANVSVRTITNYIEDFGDGTFATDYGLGFGFNLGPAFYPLAAGLPAVMYKIESKYRYSVFGAYVTQCEIHVGATVTADVVPVEFRPWTIGAPHLKADWAERSTITSQIAYTSWKDGSLAATEWMVWDARASLGGARRIITNNVSFRENVNNIPIHLQQNKDNAGLINLPFVNNTNAYQFTRDIFAQIDTPLANGLGAQCYVCVQGNGTLSTGAIMLYMGSPAVTGSNWAFLFDGNASTYINGEIKNSHASGVARLDLTANGDTSILFTHTSSGRTATFKFGNSGRRLESDVPIKLPTYTVATLPTAANVGDGAVAATSDGAGLYVVQGGAWVPLQAYDADLAAIAALTPSNDDIIQRKGGAWVNRTIAQLRADLAAAGMGYTVAKSNVQSAYTGGTAEQTLATITIPANAIGPNGRVEIDVMFSIPINANAKTLRVKFAGNTIFSNAPGASIGTVRASLIIGNRNATNSQILAPAATVSGLGAVAAAPLTLTVDTTVNQDILITGQLGTGSDTVAVESYIVRVFPSA